DDCTGELYARGSASKVRCPVCLTETDREEQQGWVATFAAQRACTYSEIPRALKVLGVPISERTWERWTSCGTDEEPKVPKIAKDATGVYSLPEVVELVLQVPRYVEKRPVFEEMLRRAEEERRLAGLQAVG